ncbi:MAG: DEAD/DEAH box helicase family protein [Planctomycetaceae bacterium]|jgi:type III restriction enzyme|nr:DEAD/DEAH box helicase family protein [Planctomycetaceae bacterium]
MKFNFKIQPFQTEAVESVVNIFNGQRKQEHTQYRRDIGTVAADNVLLAEDDTGYKNAAVDLDKACLLKNIRAVQEHNNIKLSSSIAKGLGDVSLDIEMETGTGKTYVYIKTMFELHERYGWSKFIVVVPSIAIREGVKKTFEITQEHFMELYGKKARFFVYNSANLHQLDEFSSAFGINVMIINIQAFAASLKEDGKSKESRIIYSQRDEFGSRRPIDIIKANRPIIILDEPQKMSGEATQNALKNNFNPLFSLNYSATHKTLHNLVYVLDALDAFQKKLVKKIEVKGFDIKNLRGTDKYLYLDEIVLAHNRRPRARLELEVKHKNGIKRETHIFNVGDTLYDKSNKLEQYKGMTVTDIDPFRGTITFSNGDTLTKGDVNGDVSEIDIRRIQIRETIASHFEKEEQLFQSGIKCLSLFFVDEVAKYRQYGEDGTELSGEYGKIFEEEYNAARDERLALERTPYHEYLQGIKTTATHRGYFSIDKQGRSVNSTVKRGSEFSDDISAYDLILKNKERLLSLEEPTRFIFSHSALREGWDNPNVFQICTLKHSDNATAKRQEVGRGLRICVNQNGERQDIDVQGEQVHNVNTLTVVASESYATFVADLQSKIKEDLYDRPTKATVEYFENKTVMFSETRVTLDKNQANLIHRYLIKNDYVDENDNVTQAYRDAAAAGQFAELPATLAPFADGIHQLVQSIFAPSALETMIDNGNATKVKENPLNANFAKQEFQELWKAINQRYAYTVAFDSPELIEKSVKAINENLNVTKPQYTLTEGVQKGAEFDVTKTKTRTLEKAAGSSVRYDIVGKIAEGTTLTRRSITAILKKISPQKLELFLQNPEDFINKVIMCINEQKAAVVIEHISYKPSAEVPYSQDIFNMSRDSQEYTKAMQAKKAVQDYVFTDGTSNNSVEHRFAKELEKADEVVVYAKLPRGLKGFSIPTPVGNYSPDWAIAFRKGTVKHIFFIAETKGTMNSLQLRPIEKAKIFCAKKLFNEMSTGKVKYHDVDSYQSLIDIMQNL